MIPRIIENEGEDYYFKEICKWVKKDSWVKKCFVRGYLDLLIGTKDNEFRKDKFKYDPEKDVYICPAEQQLYFFENTSKNGMKYK